MNEHNFNVMLKDRCEAAEQLLQKQMVLEYQRRVRQREPLPAFDEAGFKCYSQNFEDGILLLIFSAVGAVHKTTVEICAGNGYQCNSANLLIHHGWSGLLFDGNKKNTEIARAFYASNSRTRTWPPRIVHAWITRENINELIRQEEFAGEIDLLSIDLDGNDYWVWEALECVQPRVVVMEVNQLWGLRKAVTVPYSPDFKAVFSQYGSDYAGASLPALVKLGRRKGYRLVGCEKYGTNVFFMRHDVGEALFPEVEPKECVRHPRQLFAQTVRFQNVVNRAWVEV